MERTLSLVLDSNNRYSLTLMKGEHHEIDAFTTQFENSEQIREQFKEKIATFLEENKNYIQSAEKKSGKVFRGSIAVVEVQERGSFVEYLSVGCLYKKHISILKQLIYDPEVMSRFISITEDRSKKYGISSYVADFQKKIIRYYKIKTPSDKREINEWLNKNQNLYYEKARWICKAYDRLCEEGVKNESLSQLYKKYLEEQEKIKQERILKSKQRKEAKQALEQQREELFNQSVKEYYVIDGIRYHIDDIPFDLDQLNTMDTEFRPDGIKR